MYGFDTLRAKLVERATCEGAVPLRAQHLAAQSAVRRSPSFHRCPLKPIRYVFRSVFKRRFWNRMARLTAPPRSGNEFDRRAAAADCTSAAAALRSNSFPRPVGAARRTVHRKTNISTSFLTMYEFTGQRSKVGERQAVDHCGTKSICTTAHWSTDCRSPTFDRCPVNS